MNINCLSDALAKNDFGLRNNSELGNSKHLNLYIYLNYSVLLLVYVHNFLVYLYKWDSKIKL